MWLLDKARVMLNDLQAMKLQVSKARTSLKADMPDVKDLEVSTMAPTRPHAPERHALGLRVLPPRTPVLLAMTRRNWWP